METCCSTADCGESATDDAISIPRSIGPGCSTTAWPGSSAERFLPWPLYYVPPLVSRIARLGVDHSAQSAESFGASAPYAHLSDGGNSEGLGAWAALRRGASAYVIKTVNPDDLPATLRQALEGNVHTAIGGEETERASAKALGLTIPPSVLGRADQVIE